MVKNGTKIKRYTNLYVKRRLVKLEIDVFEIAQVFDEGEKRKALRLLIKKYSKGFEDIGEKYIDSSIERTAVLRLDIEFISAKTKGENKMQK